MPNFASYDLVDIPDSGMIETTCNRAHRTVIIIQQTKFEILSEMGVKAIVDGSYRDSVSSFASSLERLYEFFFETACRKNNISPEIFDTAWKPISSQSERQLGAFLAAFVLETGQPPKLLPQTHVEFRNSVIHKGKFPTRDEAVSFGRVMFDCALTVISVLCSNPYIEVTRTLTSERIHNLSQQAWHLGLRCSTMSIMTPLSLLHTDQTTDFEGILENYAKRPDLKRLFE